MPKFQVSISLSEEWDYVTEAVDAEAAIEAAYQFFYDEGIEDIEPEVNLVQVADDTPVDDE